MNDAAANPYLVLGITPDISDGELRRVYRELVKRHHPDHNGGSAEATARFAQIQSAYTRIMQWRQSPGAAAASATAPNGGSATAQPVAEDPEIERRIHDLQSELARIHEAERKRARASAPPPPPKPRRPTPEELGYYTTNDSFSKIIDDAADEVSDRWRGSDAKRQFTKRLTDLFGRGE